MEKWGMIYNNINESNNSNIIEISQKINEEALFSENSFQNIELMESEDVEKKIFSLEKMDILKDQGSKNPKVVSLENIDSGNSLVSTLPTLQIPSFKSQVM